MPRAEAGSTKAISNKLKSKGLTRLRWYCQTCEKACRDENGFKCHVQSESHVRQMLLIGDNAKATIDKYSEDFQREFIELLRTTHGEKKVHVNHFYQQMISNKTHTHMNATKWTSLTQFAAHLGREGIARVEETEKGLFISWIDNRPETLRRREAVMKKERQDKGDEEREQKQIQAQVERARKAELAKAAAASASAAGVPAGADKSAGSSGEESEGKAVAKSLLERKEGEKVKLSFGTKPSTSSEEQSKETGQSGSENATVEKPTTSSASTISKPKNIFSMTKTSSVKPTNAFASAKKSSFVPQQQKISQQEMIMRREMEAMEQKKRKLGGGVNAGNVFDTGKKQRVS